MDEDTKEFVVPNNDNEIIEIGAEEYIEDQTSFEQEPDKSEDPVDLTVETKEYDEESKTLKKPKKSLKEKWNKLSKKKKIIIICVGILILALVITLVVVVLKKDNKEAKETDEPVILEKDNYRYEDGVLVLLDSNDKEIGRYECQNKNENYCHVAYSASDNFDEEKYIYENGDTVDMLMPILDDKYAFIYDSKVENDEIYYYNIETKEVEEKYSEVKSYKVDNEYYLALANSKKEYGLYKFENDKLVEKISPKYDYLGIPKQKDGINTYAVSYVNNRYTLIDFNGKEISKKIAYTIKSYNNDYIVTVDENDNYQVLDYNNNKIFTNSYDFITLTNDLAIVVKDGKLNALDFNETKLINDDISLPTAYYNKTYVYDESGSPIETRESFWITNNDNNITIEYYDENNTVKSTVINVYESLTANKYNYISYYDGTLYFYSDKDKTNEIGKYKCINQNNITSADSSYDRCTIATESNFSSNELNSGNTIQGKLPIIYNRYVFISDTIDDSAKNIVLYDLKNSKALGTYLSIDAGIYTYDDEITFTNSDLTFIGLSAKKQKYGLIAIEETGASSILSVEYDSIERIGKYFEAAKSGTYQLFDETGASISDKIGYKITNYSTSYLKCIDGTNYAVADYKGNTLDKGLSFVDIESSYYVTVDNNNQIIIYNGNDKINTNIILSNVSDYIGTTNDGTNFNISYKLDGAKVTDTVSATGE